MKADSATPPASARRRPWLQLTACLLLVALSAFCLWGCGAAGGPTGPAGSDRPDPEPPAPERARRVAETSADLAFDLLGRLAELNPGGNVIISPLSISALLAMLLEGAGGETAEAIAGVLGLSTAAGEAAAADYGALLRYLAQSGGGVELAIANAVWPIHGYPLTGSFVEAMTRDFAAEVSELDLGSAEGAEYIDGWVAEQTRGRIEKMSDALGLPDPAAVMVLMNAVYFKGSWTSRFDPEATRPGTFTLPDGTEVSVPMMSQRGEFLMGEAEMAGAGGPASAGRTFLLLRLPYGEEKRFAMEILLPEPECHWTTKPPTSSTRSSRTSAWPSPTLPSRTSRPCPLATPG